MILFAFISETGAKEFDWQHLNKLRIVDIDRKLSEANRRLRKGNLTRVLSAEMKYATQQKKQEIDVVTAVNRLASGGLLRSSYLLHCKMKGFSHHVDSNRNKLMKAIADLVITLFRSSKDGNKP